MRSLADRPRARRWFRTTPRVPGPGRRVLLAGSLTAALLVGVAGAATRPAEPRLDPGRVPEVSSAAGRVRPAVFGIRARVSADRPSAATLGTERWGSGTLIDQGGLAVTVGYVVLEARGVEAVLGDGRIRSARVLGHDFESGLGLVQLDPAGAPYPAVPLGRSGAVAAGQPVTVVGFGEDKGATAVAARVTAVRPFVAFWEYMLERALIVAPRHPHFGGAALVDPNGALVGVVSLRLDEGNLAIPIDLLAPVRDALVAHGRPDRVSRPWLGIRAVSLEGGVGIAGVSPAGPAGAAGLREGDVVVRINGERVIDVGDFYRKLWRTATGSAVELSVVRAGDLRPVTVTSGDRYSVFQFRGP